MQASHAPVFATPEQETAAKEIVHAFNEFAAAKDLQSIVANFSVFLNTPSISGAPGVKPDAGPRAVYECVKQKLAETHYYGPNALLKLLDAKWEDESYKVTERKRDIKPVVVGGGIGGLRMGIEFALLGLDVTIIEKRGFFARNNSLHIWPSSIEDLKDIGVKYFYPKFCVGLINHVSIRSLQCSLLKVALLLGVKFIYHCEFHDLVPPSGSEKLWKLAVRNCEDMALSQSQPADEDEAVPVTQDYADISCNVLVGADGESSHTCEVLGFERKVFQGSRAIGITCNFENTNTKEESSLDEFGVMSIYNQSFFAELAKKGLELENLVFYKDETHYFVMTAKKESLLHMGVVREDKPTAAELLAKGNVDIEKLKHFCREVGVSCGLPPDPHFAKTPMGHEDMGIFDFSRKLASTQPEKFLNAPDNDPEKQLLGILVGDALVEPFWPLGTGANRAILAAQDAAWSVKGYIEGKDPEQVIHDANVTYEVMHCVGPEDLKQTFKQFTIDPHTRYVFKKTALHM
eukprot:Phypoly_transcript_06197.p1 GENE.Phypoly_transcript_06197~~Phypoly_transcript_06197.p1  ORF type:complete len:518 (+),score=100.67 Phypoly_transcript_06197:183-1736(+)